MNNIRLFCLLASLAIAPGTSFATPLDKTTPFIWENATIYFLLTDRFKNGDHGNDNSFQRKKDGAVLRSFEGGDITGITQKIKDGYFTNLGVTAIWLTPHVEQIQSHTDEGTGKTYAYHGYWAADWTTVDPNFGTYDEMKAFVDSAHEHGIRVLLDVVINHTGPVTPVDSQWPDDWVRMQPACTFKNRETNVECVLVDNLPDIKTERDRPVELPPSLVQKWKREGRYAQEMNELNDFFSRTGLPRAPRYYLMKWHLDWIADLGVDGFRVDTAKHTEPEIWRELESLAREEHEKWKRNNPKKKISDDPFYMTAEVYNYSAHMGKRFPFTEKDTVDFYANGFDSLINFAFKSDAREDYETLFQRYSDLLNKGELKDHSIVNYVSSHDDGQPFDKLRNTPFEAATKLLLAPGAVQIYYGDETARVLEVSGAVGDANLRSAMNWQALEQNTLHKGHRIADIYDHWGKLGRFRREHPAVGAGVHQMLSETPYVFKRTLERDNLRDKVVVALNIPVSKGRHSVDVKNVFQNGTRVKDYYSGKDLVVKRGKVTLDANYPIVLLGER